MTGQHRQLHLNAFLMSCGHHEAAWRLPESDPRADFDVAHWIALAKLAERGKLDSLFLADGPVLHRGAEFRPAGQLEPTVLLTALAVATERIGLIATDLKARAVALGRAPESVKILPGVVPILGGTEKEAQRKAQELEDLISPEYGLRQLAEILEVPIADLVLDGPLPDTIPDSEGIEGARSRSALIVALARRERLTVRQLLGRLGGGRGHWTFIGTPEQTADALQSWFEAGAADGFNVMGAALPSGLADFVEQVVPILQRRGLFRTEYAGRTLREHYGLPTPANVWAEVAPAL